MLKYFTELEPHSSDPLQMNTMAKLQENAAFLLHGEVGSRDFLEGDSTLHTTVFFIGM